MSHYLNAATRLMVAMCLVTIAYPASAAGTLPPAVGETPVPTLAPMIKRVSPAVVNIATRGTVRDRSP